MSGQKKSINYLNYFDNSSNDFNNILLCKVIDRKIKKTLTPHYSGLICYLNINCLNEKYICCSCNYMSREYLDKQK